jgi:hypothetical protein
MDGCTSSLADIMAAWTREYGGAAGAAAQQEAWTPWSSPWRGLEEEQGAV